MMTMKMVECAVCTFHLYLARHMHAGLIRQIGWQTLGTNKELRKNGTGEFRVSENPVRLLRFCGWVSGLYANVGDHLTTRLLFFVVARRTNNERMFMMRICYDDDKYTITTSTALSGTENYRFLHAIFAAAEAILGGDGTPPYVSVLRQRGGAFVCGGR